MDPPVNVVDFEAANPEVLESLLRLAIDLGGFASLGAWTATLPPAHEAAFRSNGFEAWDDSRGISDYRPGVLLRPLGEEALGQAWWLAGLEVLDLASWNLRMIYSDRY